MPFLFTCPNCQAQTEVDDLYAGQEGPCFSCGKVVKLPESGSQHLAAASELLQDRRKSDFRRLGSAALITVGVVAFAVASWFLVVNILIPALSGNSASQQLARSRSNLEELAKAMRAYHADYKSFPPAYLTDQAGQPAHSWRVLLLPYLGERALYEQYSFEEPWNGPSNSLLQESMPSVFASPGSDQSTGFGETSYLVIVGADTLFPEANTRSLNDLVDPPEQTILIAEVGDSRINWLKPGDLRTTRMRFAINGHPQTEISSNREAGALVVTADGKSHLLENLSSPDQVRALTTIAGREPTTILEQGN